MKPHQPPLLEVRNLRVYYFTLKGIIKAVDDVSLHMGAGEILGLAGESGCGKSTLGWSIMNLVPYPGRITAGEILIHGKNILEKEDWELRKEIRWSKVSMVFQGVSNVLNPLLKIGDQITETILTHTHVDKTEAWRKAGELLEMTGIESSRLSDYPHEFSTGMNQRVVIALALSCDPELIIADEPTTALDVMTQAQILEVVKDLQRNLGKSMIWITHNLSVAAELCDNVAIMYAGKIIEHTDVLSLFSNPMHPYSRVLIGSTPSIVGPKKRIDSISGSPPNLVSPPSGCRFHPRCSEAMDVCRREDPRMKKVGSLHYVACHLI